MVYNKLIFVIWVGLSKHVRIDPLREINYLVSDIMQFLS